MVTRCTALARVQNPDVLRIVFRFFLFKAPSVC